MTGRAASRRTERGNAMPGFAFGPAGVRARLVAAALAALALCAPAASFAVADAPAVADASASAAASVVDKARAGGASLFDGKLGGDRGILPVGLNEDGALYVTISRLASADVGLDNTLVSFRGEAVGEAVNASIPGYKWVLLQTNTESTSSIEVLMGEDLVAQIANFGSYDTKGSTLLVTGIYRVADPNQTGQLDVTAYAVRVLDAGGPVQHPVDYRRLWVGLGLTAAALAVLGLNVYLKRRSRS